jgi:probable addiction module antidote protein
MAKAQRFDVAEYLDNPEVIASYLSEAMETGDVEFIAEAIGDVTRAKGMTSIANETGLNRESLYKALRAGGNPEFSTVLKVLDALGVQLATAPKPDVRRHRRQARQHHAA